MFKSVPGCIEGIPGHYGMFRSIEGCSRGVPGLFRAVPGCSGGVPGVFRVLQTPLVLLFGLNCGRSVGFVFNQPRNQEKLSSVVA